MYFLSNEEEWFENKARFTATLLISGSIKKLNAKYNLHNLLFPCGANKQWRKYNRAWPNIFPKYVPKSTSPRSLALFPPLKKKTKQNKQKKKLHVQTSLENYISYYPWDSNNINIISFEVFHNKETSTVFNPVTSKPIWSQNSF